jgi:hypothetical protein
VKVFLRDAALQLHACAANINLVQNDPVHFDPSL